MGRAPLNLARALEDACAKAVVTIFVPNLREKCKALNILLMSANEICGMPIVVALTCVNAVFKELADRGNNMRRIVATAQASFASASTICR